MNTIFFPEIYFSKNKTINFPFSFRAKSVWVDKQKAPRGKSYWCVWHVKGLRKFSDSGVLVLHLLCALLAASKIYATLRFTNYVTWFIRKSFKSAKEFSSASQKKTYFSSSKWFCLRLKCALICWAWKHSPPFSRKPRKNVTIWCKSSQDFSFITLFKIVSFTISVRSAISR